MNSLDKRRVLAEMWKRFGAWKTVEDLPTGTAAGAEKLFKTINAAFAEDILRVYPSRHDDGDRDLITHPRISKFEA